MVPINNSDLAWLIVSDYNQENSKYHEELREDVLNPVTNSWTWDWTNGGVGGMKNRRVGGINRMHIVDTVEGIDVGAEVEVGGGHYAGQLVGGYESN